MMFKKSPPGSTLPDGHSLKDDLKISGVRRPAQPSLTTDAAAPNPRDDPNRPETEEDGLRAGQLCQLKVIHDARTFQLRSIDPSLPQEEQDRLAAKINDEAEKRRAAVLNRQPPEVKHASQLEYLREALARLEAKGTSSGNPFVQGLRVQIAMHERDQRRRESGGFFDEDGRVKPEWQNPMS